MDGLSRNRIGQVRLEIASLRQEHESYKLKGRHHTQAEVVSNDLRKVRLLAIQEELLKLSTNRQRIQ
jgi:hypothetical protein